MIQGEARCDDTFADVVRLAADRRAFLFPVRLLVDREELVKRVVSPERIPLFKEIDAEAAFRKVTEREVYRPKSGYYFELDITSLSPAESARRIIEQIQEKAKRRHLDTVDHQIQEATEADRWRVIKVLEENQQSTQDVFVSGTRYWLAEEVGGQTVGTIGIELGSDSILLRSAAVLTPWRGQGVGRALAFKALEAAKQRGFKKVYLFSRTAGKYWMRLGFYEVSVAEVVDALPDVPQVKHYLDTGSIWSDIAWRCDLA